MPSPLPTTPVTGRALRILATIVAGVVVLLVANTARGSQDTATPLDTQSLLTIPAASQPDPTAVPTTAPILLPTSTPTPFPTATAAPTPVPSPTPQPTAVPPTPVPTTPPSPPAAEPPAVSVADSGSAPADTSAPAPEAPEPTPTLEPQATETPLPTPTAEPSPSPTVLAVVETTPTPTPTLEPTPTPTPIPLQTAEQLEAYVLGEINAVRARAGLGPLALDPNVSLVSRDWSQQMALGGFFEHRPADQLNVMLPSGWRQWGENIASAPDIFYAQSSLENSPGHYANMVGPFTHVGIGVYTNGSQVWVTQNFVRY